MGEGLAWKGLVESNGERELYERTREATEEAQRQGAEQLKAAVKAAGAVCDSFNRWSLGFKDSRVEEAYRLKSISTSDKIDSFPVACELAACALHLFRMNRPRLVLVREDSFLESGRVRRGLWIAWSMWACTVSDLEMPSWSLDRPDLMLLGNCQMRQAASEHVGSIIQGRGAGFIDRESVGKDLNALSVQGIDLN